MKKLLSILSVVLLLLSFAGCSSTHSVDPSVDNTTEPQNSTAASETVAKPVITDYSLAGMMNVTDVYFSGRMSNGSYCKVGAYGVDIATAITIKIMCPYCNYETFDIVDLSKISNDLIGQPMFTWSNEMSCSYWDKHSNPSDNIKYSILFTLDS